MRLAEYPEYNNWQSMILRCRYRNIPVHPRWTGRGGFQVFLRHIGPKPFATATIDRKNNAKGYVPRNVRWASKVAQAQNRRTTRWIRIGCRTQTLQDWCVESGIAPSVACERIKRGWAPARAVTELPAAKQRYLGQERRALDGAVQRCHNPLNKDFSRYGARGIHVHPEWRGHGGTERLVAHIGNKPTPRHSLDRIDGTKGYVPGNVRWALGTEQACNRKSTRWLTHDGKTQPLTYWARDLEISATTLIRRLRARSAQGDATRAMFGLCPLLALSVAATY